MFSQHLTIGKLPIDFGKKRREKKSMGGRGSGRSNGYGFGVDKCHQYNSIDLAWLRRKKLFNVGRWSSLTWSRAGRETGSIRIDCHADGVRLIYRQRKSGEDWQDVSEFVPLVETATAFGGRRQWFKCLSCGSRCRILYGGAYFRCRRCYQLKYESQYENSSERACSQAHDIRKRLGQVGSLEDPFPPKPKGMHWKTYQRHRKRYEELLQRWAVKTWEWLRRLD